MANLFDRLLDTTIYFSFDRSGFERHRRDFVAGDLAVDLTGKRILITGANSGLGRSSAHALSNLGAEVWLLCRNRERGETALEDIRFATDNGAVRLELVDVSDMGSIRDFVGRLGDLPVDCVVHNAGVLPSTRAETADGLEVTWATNVVGPFLLTALLEPNLRRAAHHHARGDARVINVTSGGMYTQRLDLWDTQWTSRDFDGVVAYAQTKRAEVILTELWAEYFGDPGSGITVHSMHPGWADTPSVREALPKFWRFTRNRLRSPRQGADTIVWLAACERLGDETGRLYFDRRAVATHLLPGTRESTDDRRRLWELCCEQSGWAPDRAIRGDDGGAGAGPCAR